MSIRMRCRPCGRNYRVPRADGVWNCKQCGAPLVAAEVPEASDADADAPADNDELRRINAELKRWRKNHKALKGYFILGPGVVGVMAGVAAALLSFMYGMRVQALALVAAAIALGFFARWTYGYADRRPVAALTAFASIYTLIAITIIVTSLLRQDDPNGEGYALVCFGAWAGVLQARRSERLLQAMPEVYRRKALEERAKPSGPSVSGQHRERAKRHSKGESRIAAWILAGVALLAVLGGTGYWYSIQPSDPASTLQAFREDWERGDVEAIAAHANSPMVGNGLRKYWKQRNWVAEPPDLVGWTQQVKSKERLQVDYELAGGLVSDTRWMWSDGRWKLIAFGYPK
ncbi:MAG: hypothetical protein KDC14_18450 [Planctomycetes bacterium]|nr:hypothetical protein [Planctomycetota bacterium]